ncbi:MAG: hypothetical protein ORN49_03695, partial [Rhodobacteraceae bacterium]|nr:hypothetical protein [Paracoccaceae bacterium]
MRKRLRTGLLHAALLVLGLCAAPVLAAERPDGQKVLAVWYQLVFDLVRHTPTYTPPVASRTFAYVGVTAYEATASAPESGLVTLAGQLNGLQTLPPRVAGQAYDEALVLHAALADVVGKEFFNTGPTGQRALTAVRDKLGAALGAGLPADVQARSQAYGQVLAAAILGWAAQDGGAAIDNMGFARDFPAAATPAGWVPTNKIALQQTPLLPDWGKN